MSVSKSAAYNPQMSKWSGLACLTMGLVSDLPSGVDESSERLAIVLGFKQIQTQFELNLKPKL